MENQTIKNQTGQRVVYVERERSRVIAALLALFVGGIGAHKFYLGQTSKGILMLLTFWTFVPALIAFVEFILLLCMSNKDFDKKFNNIIVQNS